MTIIMLVSKHHQIFLTQNLKNLGIITRPQSGKGLWLSFLLPLCYIISLGKLEKQTFFDYKITTIISFGLFLQTLAIYYSLFTDRFNFISNGLLHLSPGLVSALLIWNCMRQNYVFSIVCGLCTTILYQALYYRVMKCLPRSFTLGEGAVVVQGLTLFLFNAFLQLPSIYYTGKSPQTQTTEMASMTPILQIGLIGILLLVIAIHFVPLLQKCVFFYPLLLSFIGLMIALPDSHGMPQVYSFVGFFIKDMERIAVLLAFIMLMLLAVITVAVFSIGNLQSSTSVRKIFHILIILVFVPGLIYQCSLLYVSSVLMLAVFCLLETVRIIDLPPLAKALNSSVSIFLDEKDVGYVALTPIYLLVGCSLPLWIHPVPCDITDSAGFDLLKLFSGVLSVGIGDMAASFVGVRFGRHKWSNTSKTIEGTLGSIMFQIISVYCLWQLRIIQLNYLNTICVGLAILLNAIVEAKTDQVDNLVLPLITFFILSFG
ncbi:dolichol kinase [Culicoides brevitarsis]|uniref:dolichol kinase n=1 Tax=Culicoides brevitarsis TaxID=469753 RepID=UPI00307BEF11